MEGMEEGGIHRIKMEKLEALFMVYHLLFNLKAPMLAKLQMKQGVLVCVAIMFESVADSPSCRVSSPVLCLSLMKVGSLDHDGRGEGAHSGAQKQHKSWLHLQSGRE